jgi:hypothetical protein
MLARLRFSTVQTGLVLFWAVWLSLIAMTNLFDALKQAGFLPGGWTLASYNYDLVVQTVGAHGVPVVVGALLFGMVIMWQGLAAGLFWRAYSGLRRGRPGTGADVTQAFVVSLALWAAFLIATEATVSYATAGTHKATLIAQLASLLVIRSWNPAAAGVPATVSDVHAEQTAERTR